MHESRMIAEVCPPGCCAIEKVSGSRIATPFAPPNPGSTPMITPSVMPASISSRLNQERATSKPPIRCWICSIAMASGVSEGRFDRPLGQRDLEPDLEHQEEHEDDADAHRGDHRPAVLAEVAHEHGDEDDRRLVDAEAVPGVVDEEDEDDGRNEHDEDHLELAPAHEGLVRLLRFHPRRRVQDEDR